MTDQQVTYELPPKTWWKIPIILIVVGIVMLFVPKIPFASITKWFEATPPYVVDCSADSTEKVELSLRNIFDYLLFRKPHQVTFTLSGDCPTPWIIAPRGSDYFYDGPREVQIEFKDGLVKSIWDETGVRRGIYRFAGPDGAVVTTYVK